MMPAPVQLNDGSRVVALRRFAQPTLASLPEIRKHLDDLIQRNPVDLMSNLHTSFKMQITTLSTSKER